MNRPPHRRPDDSFAASDDHDNAPRRGPLRGPRFDNDRPRTDFGGPRREPREVGDRPQFDQDRPRRDFEGSNERPRRDFADRPRQDFRPRPEGRLDDRRPRDAQRRPDDAPPDDRLVYGIRAVLEAIAAGVSIDKVWIHRDLQKAGDLLGALRQADIPFQHVPVEKLDALARGGNHQGVVAIVAPVAYRNLNEVLSEVAEAGKLPVILILDGITDVRNFGAIARSAECLGVSAIVLPVQGSVTVTPDAMKASAGALLHVPVCRESNLKATLMLMQHSGIRVVGLSEKGDVDLPQADLSGPLALLMGAEDVGISPALLKLCDEVARIPLGGRIQSLNVSVAAGIALYAAYLARQE